MGSIVDDSAVLLELGLSATVTDEERALVGQAIVRAEGAIIRHLHYDPVQRSRTEYYPQQNFDYQSRAGVWEVEGSQAVLRRRSRASVDELLVQHIPVRDTPAIDLRIDLDGRSGKSTNAFADATQKTEGTDFYPNYDQENVGSDNDQAICRDGIFRSFGRWPTTPGTVRITYTAGYTPAEFEGQDALVNAVPIWDVALDESARRAKRAFMLYKKSVSAGHTGLLTGERLGDYSYTVDAGSLTMLFGSVSDLTAESYDKLADFVNHGWALAS